jgi:hypothetical protein
MNAEKLKRSIKVCMFDQYGTVVDLQGGLREAAAGFLDNPISKVRSGLWILDDPIGV